MSEQQEATPLTRQEIQTRWTQDLSLIFSTLETMAVEREWCGEWSRLVRVANEAITVKLPRRNVVYRAKALVENDYWCIYNLREYAGSQHQHSLGTLDDVIDLETIPVNLPESLTNDELLAVWEEDIKTINRIFNRGAMDNSKVDDWLEVVEEINPAMRIKLVVDLEREVSYTITYTYQGTMTIPYTSDVYCYVAENVEVDTYNLEVQDVDWNYE